MAKPKKVSEGKEISVQTDESLLEDGLCMVCKGRLGDEDEEDEDEEMNGPPENEEEEEDDEERQLKIVEPKIEEEEEEEQRDEEEVSQEAREAQPKRRRPIGSEWAPNSFSSMFTCYFCNEQFRKDYKLKLHLMMNHKGESAEDMAKAKEELTKSKLDGCVHM